MSKNKSRWSRKQVVKNVRIVARNNGYDGSPEYVVIIEFTDGQTSSTHFSVMYYAQNFARWAVKNAR